MLVIAHPQVIFKSVSNIHRTLQVTLFVMSVSLFCQNLTQAKTLSFDDNTSIIDENRIVSVDSEYKTPSFIWLKSQQFSAQKFSKIEKRVDEILTKLQSTYQLTDKALAAIQISHIHNTGNGAIVVQLKQYFQAMEVLQRRVSIVFNQKLQPISISGFVSKQAPEAHTQDIKQTSKLALSTAFEAFSGKSLPANLWQDSAQSQNILTNTDITTDFRMKLPLGLALNQIHLSRPATAHSGWLLVPGKAPILAIEVEMELSQNSTVSKMNQYIISADQKILSQKSLTTDAAKTYTVWADANGEQQPFAGPQGNSQFPHPTGEDDDTIVVVINPETVTLDSASFSRQDPWLAANQTTTQGNNVNAYVDISLPDGFTPFSSDHPAAETSPATFDYSYNFSADPNLNTTLQNAAIVQAFYVTNFIHDWLYDSGFNEQAGNGQNNNFGRGGFANDAMLVEVQDFEERNNANMTTPSDGSPARMQIFMWDGETSHQLDIEAPSPLAGTYETGAAAFGPTAFDISQQLVLVDDGIVDPAEADSTIHDACEDPILNAVDINGRIAVIDRGVCFFVEKVDRVEALGAVAVIIINQKTDGVITMGAGDNPPQIDIPSLMISKADGDPLRAALLNGDLINVRITRTTSVDRNAGLDNSLIAHEWGHFLNNRLVVINNTQSQGMDEGWSDFLALLFLTRDDDIANINGAFTISAYANNRNNALYFGIRRVPYSVDTNLNALTFKHIANGEALPTTNQISFGSDGSDNAEVHATGEIWATMLWEGYVSLINDPRHSFTEAQTRMKNYLVASLKATPADANFVEARDALLSVIAANDAADRQTFMDAFARRGLGVGAIAPARTSEENANPVESFVTDTVQPPPVLPPTPSSGGGGSLNFMLILLITIRLGLGWKLSSR